MADQPDLRYRPYVPAAQPVAAPVRKRVRFHWRWLAVALAIAAGLWWSVGVARRTADESQKRGVASTAAQHQTSQAGAQSVAPPNPCASNTLPQFVQVSIGQRRLWACAGAKQLYTSAVVTGYDKQAADITPTGTYHVYAKQTDRYLTGSDNTGTWNDYVHYWLPFLDNQYGTYGFHDATWRADSAFGTISPDSPDASHGCVEVPLAAAAWLYNWAQVGATVTIAN